MGIWPLRRANRICKGSKVQKTMAPSTRGKKSKITREQGSCEGLEETPSYKEGNV